MRKTNIILIVCIVLVFFIISPLILAPILHNDNSQKSAIRNYLQNAGYPYQSFFAIIKEINADSYVVSLNDWNNETDTGYICDAKRTDEDTYKISCVLGIDLSLKK